MAIIPTFDNFTLIHINAIAKIKDKNWEVINVSIKDSIKESHILHIITENIITVVEFL